MKNIFLYLLLLCSFVASTANAQTLTAQTSVITNRLWSARSAATITVIGTTTPFLACISTASAQQSFTVSGSGLTANIVVTAPTGFEVSTASVSGYSNSVALPQSSGGVATTTIYARMSATATGAPTGNISVSSTGATTHNVAVSGSVNPLPTVNSVSNQTLCVGSATADINFAGTATSYNWTNSNPAIGLAASGTGNNIAAFTATNNTAAPITSTVMVTPNTTAADYAYISNLHSDNVSVINTVTNTVVTTVTVGHFPSGVSVSLNGSRVYVANQGSDNVSVINTATNVVVATVVVGSKPYGVSVSPDGSRVYVANFNSNTVSVINTATNVVVATIGTGYFPIGLSVSPDGSRLYVSNQGSNDLSVINTATNTLVSMVPMGTNPYGVFTSPDGSRVYVGNRFSNTISVINTTTNTIVATVAVGTNPIGISMSPDGSKVYVTNVNSNNVSIINTATNTVVATVAVGNAPIGISVSLDGSQVYVANSNSSSISVINTATNTVVATVAVDNSPVAFGNFIKMGAVVCTGTPATFTVTVNPSITASITQTGNNLTATGTPPLGTGAIYQWSTGANTATISITANGIYTVTVTDANGCSATRTINAIITSIDNNNALAGSLSLYPNPTDGIVTLSFDNINNVKGNILLFNTLGQVIETPPLSFGEGRGKAEMTIDLTQQAAGLYFLKIESLGGKMIRIVKH